jgi:hypothetical protein
MGALGLQSVEGGRTRFAQCHRLIEHRIANTGVRSPGEELMTPKTSAVAVCCSKASFVSVMRRAFSHRDDRLRSEILQQRDLNAPVCRAYSSEFARLKGQ